MSDISEHNLLPNRPIVAGTAGRNLPIPLGSLRAASDMLNYGPEPEADEPRVPLSHYLWILRRHCWKIFSFVAIAVIATLIVSKRITPVYESTATIDIDRQLPPGIIGQESNRTTLNDADQFLATQVKLIQSDAVLRPVADRYKLREQTSSSETKSSVPFQDTPVKLKNLKVTRPPNTYLLLVSYRSTNPRLAADVANAVTRSYLEHTYTIRFQSSASLAAFMEKQLEEVKAKMERSGFALGQFEKDLSVINPEEKTSILSSRLLQLNTEFTNAQMERVRKETALNSVKSGTLESAQVSSQGESLKRLSERVDDARQTLVDVQTHYGPNHPEYRKAAARVAVTQQQLEEGRTNIMQRIMVEYNDALGREAMLKQAVTETKAEFDHLNARSFDYHTLKREAEADRKLYEELMSKIKEAGINAGFQNSAIRIADLARPALKQVYPDIPLNLTLAALFSTLAAIGLAILADLLNTAVRDPDQVTRLLRTDVVGVLPRAKVAHMRVDPSPVADVGSTLVTPGKSRKGAMTGYGEAIRSLRNSIFLTDFDRRVRSLMIASPSPSEGKSTIAANLAVANAQQGRRTLLIDGDLRRPAIHRHFSIPNNGGFSSVLNREATWKSVVTPCPDTPNLDLMTAGPPSRRAADLPGPDLAEILEEISANYDLLILDTPPLLGFSETLQMATAVDGVVVVALVGKTNRKALGAAIATLGRVRANLVGVVLNGVTLTNSEGSYYHPYGAKYYKQYQEAGAV